MSLGLAPLSGLDSPLAHDLRQATAGETLQRASTKWESISWFERSAAFLHRHKLLLGNYSSLHFFKKKFNPLWEPRYLVVRDSGALPRVLAALAQAHGYTWRAIIRESGLPALFSARHIRRQPRDTVSSI